MTSITNTCNNNISNINFNIIFYTFNLLIVFFFLVQYIVLLINASLKINIIKTSQGHKIECTYVIPTHIHYE